MRFLPVVFRLRHTAALLFLIAAFGTISLSAQTADNSRQNKDHTVTADTQSNTSSDRQTTAKIRKAIHEDKELSTSAHNIKVITVNGLVTLKGPVQSEEEKQKVIADATSVVASPSISDQLTVKQ